MSKSLTDIGIRNLKPGTARKEIPEGGARGLYLVIQPSGVKSFAVRYRLNGKPQKLTLGRWRAPDDPMEATASTDPKVGEAISLASARKLAADTLLQAGRGRDPVASKRQVKQERRRAAENTFRAIAEQYLRRECGMRADSNGNVTFDRTKLRSGAERYRVLKRQVFSSIGDLPIIDIKKSDIVRLLDKIESGELKSDHGDLMKGGPVQADRTLALIRKIMNWHAVRSDDYRPPIVRGMARVKANERARSRILNDHELRAIWKAAEAGAGPFDRLVQFLLLTGARRSEAAEMIWAEVEGADWTLPAARNKVKKDLVRPLSEAARAVLATRPRIEGCPYVFSSGQKALAGYSRFKINLDEAVLKKLREEDAKAEALSHWTLHDLRRTARSLMSRARVDSDHAERCLGHVIGGVKGIYDRHTYHAEIGQAYEVLAALIERIVHPAPANVVSIAEARG
jgi:integrase